MVSSDYFAKLRSDFEEFYYQKLWLKLTTMEQDRLKYLHRFWILFFLMGVLLPALIIFIFGEWFYLILTQGSPKEIESLVKLCLLGATMIIAVIGSPIVTYKLKIKDSIIEDFINYFGSFRYSPLSCIHDDIIRNSLLFNSYNRHSSDDHFYGTYKNVTMTISEENLRYKHNKGESKIFKGIIILLDFPKSFQGQTVVFSDWGIFNFLHKIAIKLQHISFEDPVFEKKFEVFSNDQIEARFLLTTAFMERMLKVKKVFGGKKIQFSFFDNKLLIAVSSAKDMFEPSSLFKSSTDRRPINEVLEQFISVFAVIEFLKLTQQ